MNDVQKNVYKAIAPKTPRLFWDVRHRVPGFLGEREIDRALQALRRKGKIKYLKKADGGPGWVRA